MTSDGEGEGEGEERRDWERVFFRGGEFSLGLGEVLCLGESGIG